jgi:hypothetical protein
MLALLRVLPACQPLGLLLGLRCQQSSLRIVLQLLLLQSLQLEQVLGRIRQLGRRAHQL